MSSGSRDDTTTRSIELPRPQIFRATVQLGAVTRIVDAGYPSLAIGRDADCDVVVETPYVSRRHATIEHRNGKIYVVDRSTNGTYLSRVAGSVLYLHDELGMLEGRGTIDLGRLRERPLSYVVETRAGADAPWTPGASAGTETPVDATPRNLFRLDGDYWTIAYGGPALHLRDAKGLRFIAELLRQPGREIHVLDLARGGILADALSTAPSGHGLSVDHGQGTGPQLDRVAKVAYRHRLGELRADLEEAERFNDVGAAARAHEEIEFLTAELAAATGLGGRDRESGSHVERARVLVTVRIRSAIKKIEQCEPALGRHLATTIKTGRLCSYNPEVRQRIVWTL